MNVNDRDRDGDVVVGVVVGGVVVGGVVVKDVVLKSILNSVVYERCSRIREVVNE